MNDLTTTAPVTAEFEYVREDALRWFSERVDRLNRIAAKIGAGGFEVTTVETEPRMDRAEAARITTIYFSNFLGFDPTDPGPYTGPRFTVTITGAMPQIEGGWQVLAAIDHEVDDHGAYRNIVRGYEDGLVAEWLTAEPNCDHCGANRGRKMTVVVRDAEGAVRQVGTSCMRDFVGHQGVETLMALADYWGTIVPDLDVEGMGPLAAVGEAAEFAAVPVVALALAATKAFGYRKSGYLADGPDGVPTRTVVETLLAPKTKGTEGIFEAIAEAVEVLGGEEAVAADAAAAIEWVASQDGDNDYMTNMASIFAKSAVSRGRLGFAVSLASVWNREQDRISERKARAEAEGARKADATDAPEGRSVVEGIIVATKTYESDFGSTEKMTVLADAGFKVFVTIPNSIAFHQQREDGSYDAPAGRGDRVRFTATFERSNDDSTFAFGKRPAKAEILARAEEQAA